MTYKLDANEIGKAVADYLRKEKVKGSESPYYYVTFSEDDDDIWVEVSFQEVKLGGDIG